MRSLAFLLALAALPWLPACSATEAFTCNADAQCVTDGAAGRCEAEGVCSFPDEACGSGHRYGLHAGALSGECVGEGSSGATTTDVGMTSVSPEDTLGIDGSSTGPSTSSTSSTSTTTTTTTPTTDPPDSTTEPVFETTSTTNTTGTELDPYGPCLDGGECADPDSFCIMNNGPTVCAPPCETQEDCPPALGNSDAMCISIDGITNGCVLLCRAPDGCPEGMQCLMMKLAMVGFCAWG